MRPRKNQTRPKGSRNGKSKYSVDFIRAHKIKVPNHPSEFCSQPWFPLTVRMNNPTNIVDAGTMYSAIVAQLSGLSFTVSLINIRLHSVRVWGPIPTTNTPLVVRFYDLFDEVAGSTPTGNLVIEEITDYADQVNRARIGYVYSTAQQQKSLLVTAGSSDKLMWVSGGGLGSVAYFRLLWRPFPQGAPPALDDFERLSVGSANSVRRR